MAQAKLAPIKLLKDYWDADSRRMKANMIIDLPIKEAKALIEAGKAVRADPMPGDDE